MRRAHTRGHAVPGAGVSGKKRCRMHGGAKGSGAPAGNQNALKTGHHTRKAIAQRRQMRAFIKGLAQQLEELE